MPTGIQSHHEEFEPDWVMRPDRYVYDRPMAPATAEEMKDPQALLEKRHNDFEKGESWSQMMTQSMHGGVISQFTNSAPSVNKKVHAVAKPATTTEGSQPTTPSSK
jgi:hypothetical protein